jgi:hypothetical protein
MTLLTPAAAVACGAPLGFKCLRQRRSKRLKGRERAPVAADSAVTATKARAPTDGEWRQHATQREECNAVMAEAKAA